MRLSHNSRYEALQSEYLKTRKHKLLEGMYNIAREAAANYITKYCRKKGFLVSGKAEKSHDSAMFVIEQYLRKPGFRIKRLSAYIHFGVMKALFRDKDFETKESSYDQLIENGGIR